MNFFEKGIDEKNGFLGYNLITGLAGLALSF